MKYAITVMDNFITEEAPFYGIKINSKITILTQNDARNGRQKKKICRVY